MPPVTTHHIMNTNDLLFKLVSAIILAGVIVAFGAPNRSDNQPAVSAKPAITVLVEASR